MSSEEDSWVTKTNSQTRSILPAEKTIEPSEKF